MNSLPDLTLGFDRHLGRWQLVNERTAETLATFATQSEALEDATLSAALGELGGVVKIQDRNGRPQERRTYRGNLSLAG